VALAENGIAACELGIAAAAAGRPFDVILMDLQMPGLDGYAATMRLRSAGYRGVIVALTAHVMTTDRERCLATGCDGFVSKPITRRTLIETVARHLPAAAEETAADPLVSEVADDSELTRALAAFVERLPERIAAMEHAFTEGNTDVLADLAHQLKGVATGYGYPTITEAAGMLEAAARSGRDLEDVLAGLRDLCRRASVPHASHRGSVPV
jgi:CheY-like chemotaxis protein/HPt (histidine-containing phosphotransfer) domain-containing protein